MITNEEAVANNTAFLVKNAGFTPQYARAAAEIFDRLSLGSINAIVNEQMLGKARSIAFDFTKGRFGVTFSKIGAVGVVCSVGPDSKVIYGRYE